SDLVRIVKRVLNEDTLVLNSFAKKLYSFLKQQNIESELKREMGPNGEFNFHNIGGKDKEGEFWGKSWGVQIQAINTFEGADFSYTQHKSGPFVYVSFNNYTGEGVDELVEDFLSNFPELKIHKKIEDDNGEIDAITIIENKR
ncbi:MAG: hypothetical protein ACK5EG_05860, partial [Chitinophagaceae bacterium]